MSQIHTHSLGTFFFFLSANATNLELFTYFNDRLEVKERVAKMVRKWCKEALKHVRHGDLFFVIYLFIYF